MEEIFDILIVGLGPAGHKAALCAVKRGFRTVAFEKCAMGGTCLNLGCIPTKTIMYNAEILKEAAGFEKNGVLPDGTGILENFNFKKLYEIKDDVVQKLSKGMKFDLEEKGVKIVQAQAFLEKEDDFFKVKIEDKIYRAKIAIWAGGSVPMEVSGLEFDHSNILNSNDILALDECPKSLLIVGSGAIGTEWARIFSALNCKVTVVEKAPNLLPACDTDIQKRLMRIFKAEKVQYNCNTTVLEYKNGVAKLSNGKEVECGKILVAVGRKRFLPEVYENGKSLKVTINQDFSTNIENFYVIGDSVSTKMLAHTASAQATRLLAKLSGENVDEIFDTDIPTVVYGTPEIASIGLREQDLPENWEENPEYKIYNFRVANLPKAWCDNCLEGFIKIITKDRKILGAHIVSKEAAALIAQIQVAMRVNADVDTLKSIIYAHPTFCEGILEAISQ